MDDSIWLSAMLHDLKTLKRKHEHKDRQAEVARRRFHDQVVDS